MKRKLTSLMISCFSFYLQAEEHEAAASSINLKEKIVSYWNMMPCSHKTLVYGIVGLVAIWIMSRLFRSCCGNCNK